MEDIPPDQSFALLRTGQKPQVGGFAGDGENHPNAFGRFMAEFRDRNAGDISRPERGDRPLFNSVTSESDRLRSKM